MAEDTSSPTANPYKNGLAFLNGDYVPLSQAAIPITDTGFTRSDATYDVVSVWHGKFFRLDAHSDRFMLNVEKKRFSLPYDRAQIQEILTTLVARSGLHDAYVSMTATRGVPSSGSRDLRLLKNRFYAFACPYIWVFSQEQQERGIRAIVSTVQRIPSASVDPTVKNYHWGDLISGTWEAFDQGAEACVLLDREGNITEGAGYNVFAVVAGTIVTPESSVLLGITRRTVLELAQAAGIPSQVRDLPLREFQQADEVFFATTAGGVMPVTELDGHIVGDGRPGPVSQTLKRLYWDAHDEPRFSTTVSYE